MTTWFLLIAIGALSGSLLTYALMNLNDILSNRIDEPHD